MGDIAGVVEQQIESATLAVQTWRLKIRAECYSWLNEGATEVKAKGLHRRAARRRHNGLHQFTRRIINTR
jgi:hypothetical protein